jgi:hypothetical protein
MNGQLLVIVIEAAIRATALAAMVGALLWILRVPRGALRHSAWLMVVVAMLLMPGLQRLAPALPAPLPPRVAEMGVLFQQSEPPIASPATIPAPAASPIRAATDRTGPLPTLPAKTMSGATDSPIPWMALAGALYLLVTLVLLLRLLVALWTVGLIVRRARPVGDGLWESSAVVTPVTIGILQPRILLPAAWTMWPDTTRDAVIAHERAHVSRRDPLVALLARLNACVFWFHPLAWWLERTVAAAAEHACDEAALGEVSHPRQYAEALLTMATASRHAGGRIAWAGVRAEGSGRLDDRIDRILGGGPLGAVSRARKWFTVACVGAAIVVVACRQQVSPTPLREDPELAKRLAAEPAQTKKFEDARDMTQEQADSLEQRLATNPEDFDARWQLVTYYWSSSKVAWDKKVPGQRRHALWLIEHHPEHDVQAPPLSPRFDPDGFAAAKKLWEAHLAKPDASPFLVYRAASFFAHYDKPYAERLTLRGMAMDPDSAALKARLGPGYGGYEWPVQLASLYAAAIRGSQSVWGTYNDLRKRPDLVDSQYAMEVRRRLEVTTDARLLARVGGHLVLTGPIKDPAAAQIRALGVRYLERALELDPNLTGAKAALVRVRLPELANDADRLAERAQMEFVRAEGTEYYEKDMAAGKRRRDEAKAAAEQVLKMAAPHAGDPAYSAAVMTAHQTLAAVALRDGDRERAVQHIRESVKVPSSERLQYAMPFSWMTPANRLLKQGERESVVEFLEALARLTITERDRLLADAGAIREGRMPTSYQYMVASQAR